MTPPNEINHLDAMDRLGLKTFRSLFWLIGRGYLKKTGLCTVDSATVDALVESGLPTMSTFPTFSGVKISKGESPPTAA